MKTHSVWSKVTRVALGTVCLVTSTSCGGELLRTGRAPVYLSVRSMGGILRSDVLTGGAAVDDLGSATIGVTAKNQGVPTTPLNDVTLTRYHVEFRRSDGRNTPGVDVPYAFDGGLGVTIAAGDEGTVSFQLVRQQSKVEPPLRNMTGLNGLLILSTIAQVTFFGRDQNGNELMVTGNIDVQFADFPDS